jgi:hypothetical protein
MVGKDECDYGDQCQNPDCSHNFECFVPEEGLGEKSMHVIKQSGSNNSINPEISRYMLPNGMCMEMDCYPNCEFPPC